MAERVEYLAKYAKKEMNTTILGAVPVVDTMRTIFWNEGLLKYKADSTLNLEAILYKMAKEGKTLNQAINEVFHKGMDAAAELGDAHVR